MVVTADVLYDEITSKRGNENLVFACNGVDIEHFHSNDDNCTLKDNFKAIIKQNKKMVGYYGSLAVCLITSC